MSYLLRIHGMRNRLVHLDSKTKFTHIGLEVYYDKAWHFLDPTLGIYFYLKNYKYILSLKDIKKNLYNNNLLSNKKISFNKFKNNIKKHLFYYKKKKSFKDPGKKYLKLFSKTEHFSLLDTKFPYKKKFSTQYGLTNFSSFREIHYFDKDFIINKSNFSYGLIDGHRVESNKFVKFKNYIFKKKINLNKVDINDFPFLILDLKLHLEAGSNKLNVFVNSEKYNISIENKSWLLSQLIKKKNIFTKPIRSFSILSNKNITFLEILFLKSDLISKGAEK